MHIYNTSLLRVVGSVILVFSFSLSAFARWNIGSYTTYPPGIHSLAAPAAGQNQHYAQDANGNTGTGTLWYDPNPPALNSSSQIFVANHSKSVTLQFKDCDNPGTGCSGVSSSAVTITGPNGVSIGTFVGATNLTFTGNFSKAGKYKLSWSATDGATNAGSNVVNDFFTVVAAPPDWDTPGASTITTSSAIDTRIADGVSQHTTTVTLKDKYGNPIVPISGSVSVTVKFKLQNTTPLNQIAGTGDAILLSGACELVGSDTGTGKITECTATTSSTGVYDLNIHSYAPTSNAYPPINLKNFKIGLDKIEYVITGLGGADSSKSNNQLFKFEPALTAIPTALNYDQTETSAINNITINSSKRFGINVKNQSSTKNVSDIKLGLLMTTSASSVKWGGTALEANGSENFAPSAIINLDTDTSDPFSETSWSSPSLVSPPNGLDLMNASTQRNLRIRSTPILAAGEKSPSEFDTLVRLHLNYIVNGRNPRHAAFEIGNADNAKIRNLSIQAIGAARSQSGFTTTTSDSSGMQNIGNLALNEAKIAIDRNIASFLNLNSNRACPSVTIKNIDDWNNLINQCGFSSGKILYFRDANVILDSSSSAINLPGNRTILLDGGNLFIKKNLIINTASGMFGVVAVKRSGSGGNVYIYPNVTDVTAALYAEGSVVSVNHASKVQEYLGSSCPPDGSGGFCDRSKELNNQLYWVGVIISQNTVGGSDENPYSCPASISSCTNRTIARVFDLNYLRTFHPHSGGTRSNGLTGSTSNDHAFVIRYDGAVKSTPPPIFEDILGASSSLQNY